jgi:antitoxin VapB
MKASPSLNIKSAEAHELAQKLAEATGKSMTVAVTEALRDQLDRLQEARRTKKTVAALLEIGRQGAKMFPGPHVDHGDLLYDEKGLPK